MSPKEPEKKVKDTPEEIKAWLSRGGYPLEMAVARAFRNADCNVIQSERYASVDPKSNAIVQREIDVVAGLSFDSRTEVEALVADCPDFLHSFIFEDREYQNAIRHHLTCGFAVECKYSVDSSWAIFTSSDTTFGAENLLQSRFFNPAAKSLLKSLTEEERGELPLFRFNGRIGYGIKATTEGPREDRAFDAVLKVKEACEALTSTVHHHDRVDHLIMYLPVVVVEGKLFEVYLSPEGETVVDEVGWANLYYRDAQSSNSTFVIDVVSSEHLSDFIDASKRTFELIYARHLKSAVEKFERSKGIAKKRALALLSNVERSVKPEE